METLSPKRFLLTGTRSQLGVALRPLLAARGDTVTAVASELPADQAGVTWLQGRLPELAAPFIVQDAIISFGPMDALAEWLDAMSSSPALRVVATSSMSAVSKENAQFPEDRAISERLLNGEVQLQAACKRLSMPCTILRPTMIYGMGLDENVTAVARAAMRRGIFVAPSGRGLRQPVHAEDVAAAALTAALVSPPIEATFEIGGGERLTGRDMFRRVHASLPRKTLLVPAPHWMMALLARVSRRYRGAVSRLDSDLTADNRLLETRLGIHPRGFQPEPATWRDPRS